MKRLILLLVIAGVATGAYFVYKNANSAPKDRILVSGNIELTQVNIGFKTAGRLIERSVDEGDTVTKGQVVAKLDQEQLLRQKQREQASLVEAQAMLAQSQTGLEMQQQLLTADMDSRNADLSTSQSHLLEMKNGARPQEIAQAVAAVDAAQSEYDRAKKDWDRAEGLHKTDDISTSQYDAARAHLDSASSQLSQAKERASLLKAGNRVEDIDAATSQVARAQAGVRAGQANQLDIKRRQQEIAARQAEIERSRAQIALIDSQLADTIVASPISGIVLVKSADVGEVVAPGTAVLTVGDLDHPWLRAYINETDLSRVKLGSKVKVTTDAAKSKVYDGVVTFINSEAEFTPKQIQTTEERVKLVYRVKIEIDNRNHELKSNMPADAEILVN